MAGTVKSKVVNGISLLSVTTGFIILLGWYLNIALLESIIPHFVAIKVNAAFCFILLGCILYMAQEKKERILDAFFLFFNTIVIVIAIATLTEYAFKLKLGIDEFFVIDKKAVLDKYPYPGRMGLNTAICFLFLAITLPGLRYGSLRAKVFFQYMLHAVTAIATVALLGYLYGVSSFYNFFYVSSMALPTAIVIFSVSIAASTLNKNIGFTKLFIGDNIGDKTARRYFGLMVSMMLFFGFLRVQTERYHVFTHEMGGSIMALFFFLGVLFIVQNIANWLNTIDNERAIARAEVNGLNALLERRVEQRSLQLNTLIEQFQKSEEKYRSLIEQASDSIYVLDSKGDFMEVNKSMCKMIGYTPEELLSMNVVDLLGAEELAQQAPIYQQVEAGRSAIGERKYLKKGGTQLDVEVNVKKLVDGRSMVIARDITRRKEMEAELKQAELKFRILAERSVVGIYIVNDGRFVYVNPRFAQIFGYDAHELLGRRSVDTIVHPDYREISRQHVLDRMNGKIDSVHYEAMGFKKDGSTNWVEFYGSSTLFDNQMSIVGTMIDITERKYAENELRVSEHKYRMFFNSNPLPMLMIGKNDLAIVAANDAAVKLYGYTVHELLKMTVIDLRPFEDRVQMMQMLYLHKNSPSDSEIVRHIKKDGSVMKVQFLVHDITLDGQPIRLALTNDLTEKLAIEEAHRKSEANLKTILYNTDTAYVLIDRDLKILEYNKQALIFNGSESNNDPLGSHIFEYMPKKHIERFSIYLDQVLKGKTISYEAQYAQAGGAEKWYYIRMFPVQVKESGILGLVIAITDITERKNVEESLQEAYKRIEKHIESIKEMVWKQSHLIRSPLANLKGLISLISDAPDDKEAMAFVEAELNRLDHVIISMANDPATNDILA